MFANISAFRRLKPLFFAESTFFHAGQREKKSFFFTLKLIFFTLEGAA
jgi:hypothetical protein